MLLIKNIKKNYAPLQINPRRIVSLHKFHAKKTEVDGIKFPSRLEARVYCQLKLLRKSNLFLFFLRQIPFDLPGPSKHFVDFCVFYKNGVKFIEAKGRDLPVGRLKRKQAEDLYQINIAVIKNIKQLNEILFS